VAGATLEQKSPNQSSLVAEKVGDMHCLNFLAVDQKLEIEVFGLSVEVYSLQDDNLAYLRVLRAIAH